MTACPPGRRLVVPGKQNISIWLTLAIGVLAAILGTLVAGALGSGSSLLIGESALPEEVSAVHTALLSTPGVDRIIHLRTMHLGPEELLVAAKIAVSASDNGASIAATIDDAEARLRQALPTAKVVYLEPDIDRQRSVACFSRLV
ncbi:cation transporter dimerization domain-containing protein [Micromonospora ureilytica]|uniref:cation transporter dimerization domain-containing protein n=1 Tax=Micromonospora ureilytica TaxID=709868 RepID=UPI0040399542